MTGTLKRIWLQELDSNQVKYVKNLKTILASGNQPDFHLRSTANIITLGRLWIIIVIRPNID